MKKWITQLHSFINKDIINENETKRYAVVLRILSLLMCLYSLMNILMFILEKSSSLIKVNIFFLLLYITVLYFTYEGRTRISMWIMNTALIVWVVISVVLMGWNSGMQQFLLFPLVLYMFSSGGKPVLKFFFPVFLIGIQVGLYYYCFNSNIAIPMSSRLNSDILQTINTIYIFLELFVITYNFSITSRESEEKLIAYNKKLERLAITDGLTGLMNRRPLIDYLEAKEREEKREYKLSAIAIGDIDHFKRVNDTYGHECGDQVLIQLSNLMRDFMAGKGLVARWGGEEFLMIFEGRNGDEAFTELFELQHLIKKMKVVYKEQELSITMTFGLEEYVYARHLEIIKRADNKLYMGKEGGRDRIVY